MFPVTAGKKNKLRVYYLSWLRNKILHNDPEVEKKQGWTTVGDLEGCVHYKVGTSQEDVSCLHQHLPMSEQEMSVFVRACVHNVISVILFLFILLSRQHGMFCIA